MDEFRRNNTNQKRSADCTTDDQDRQEAAMPVIRPIRRSDIAECITIYNRYITETTSTFEIEPLTVEAFDTRVSRLCRQYPFLVCTDGACGRVLGYAYLSPFGERAAYRFTCDVSIYLDMEERGRGLGRMLYQALEAEAVRRGFYSMVAIVTGENAASMEFHARMGFSRMAEFPEMGYKFGRWLSVCYYRKRLRTPIPGEIPIELLPQDIPYLS